MNRTQTSKTTEPATKLELLRLPELQQRYAEVVGEPTRCPNRAYLTRRIIEALAARAPVEASPAEATSTTNSEAAENSQPIAPAMAAPSSSASPTSNDPLAFVNQRGRLKSLTIEELQAKYLEIVGRATASTNRSYLVWKVREAAKGRVPIGPLIREERARELGKTKTLPFRIGTRQLEGLDAAWKAHGAKNRMDFFRLALGHYLGHIGAAEAAALFATAS